MKIKEHKGITLIALVVTIVVLLILAGVTISMLRGENGIIKQAQKANDATIVGKEKEAISIAYSNAKGKKISSGQTSTVTASELQTEMINNKENVKVEGTGKLKITFNETGHEYEIDENEIVTRTDSGNGSGGSDTGDSSLNGMYSTGGITEADIALANLFEYKILDNSSKTAKITRIKEQYCNFLDGNTTSGIQDTNYEIKYDGITNKLVIPYKSILQNPDTNEKEQYTITEVCLAFKSSRASDGGREDWNTLPSIETIVYPNTVTKIYSMGEDAKDNDYAHGPDHNTQKIILSENIEEIPKMFFENSSSQEYKGITSIKLPNKVKKIGDYAFGGCEELTDINLENVTEIGERAFVSCYKLESIKIPEVQKIGSYAFGFCSKLKNIEIPKVQEIEWGAFDECTGIKTITITSETQKVGEGAFESWKEDQTINVFFSSKENKPSGWDTNWKGYFSKAKVNYTSE